MAELKQPLIKPEDFNALKEKARQHRVNIVKMIHEAQSGHPGGSLSAIDILTALYYTKLNLDSDKPKWEDRDRFIYSKGHACPALYSILSDLGFFKEKELWKFRKFGGLLQGHSTIKIPGIDMSSGSLGMGLSYANGIALARNLDKKDYRVYVFLGDGELEEGEIWEAAMTSATFNLDITCIVDANQIQNDDFVKKTKEIEPLSDKWKSFGWKVKEIDGHDFEEIIDALNWADNEKSPAVILARTRKGKGVSFMELNPKFHGMAPNDEEFEKAMKELKK